MPPASSAHRPRLARIAVRGENIAGPASSPAAGARRVTAAIAVEPNEFPLQDLCQRLTHAQLLLKAHHIER